VYQHSAAVVQCWGGTTHFCPRILATSSHGIGVAGARMAANTIAMTLTIVLAPFVAFFYVSQDGMIENRIHVAATFCAPRVAIGIKVGFPF
jgi:aromatic ring hydroxylase